MDPLPCWAHLSPEQYKQQIRALCNDIREQAAHERSRTGRPVVGLKRLMRLSAHYRPDGVAKSPAPPIHCRDKTLRLWFVAAYKAFVDAYRAAYGRLHRVATSGDFPPGGVPPTRVVGAQVL
ncbi:MAG TPA: hypothetical protein EYN66_05075 [Myxococcales bacterium]|nr:hypothetical protein [Myxococcales bacterium]